MSKILQPLKPSLTITIEVEESTGKTQIVPSKPVAPAIMFELVMVALRGAFQATVSEYEKALTAAKLQNTVKKGNGWGSNHGQP